MLSQRYVFVLNSPTIRINILILFEFYIEFHKDKFRVE